MLKKDLLVTSLGNILEWFDFGLFIFLAPILSTKFFPMHHPAASLVTIFGVFAAGYICRPLGGILFGHFGDTHGRIKALRRSILSISLATFLVGCLPSYHTIGLMAPIIFTVLRLIQGLSAGGEYCGIMIYLAESSSIKQRGLMTSFAGSGASLGFFLATLMAILLKSSLPLALLESWGWRLPFILIGLIGFIVLYYRLRLEETQAYLSLKAQDRIERKPLWAALRFAPKSLLKIVGITCLSATFYIIFFGYMPRYLATHGAVSLTKALSMQSILLFLILFFIPLGGFLGDRFGRKRVLLMTGFAMLVLVVPCFYGLHHSLVAVGISWSIAMLLSACDQGNNLSALVENCPVAIRYSGLGFAFNLGNAIFGGLGPLVAELLVTHVNVMAPAYLLMGTSLVGLVAIATLFPKAPEN